MGTRIRLACMRIIADGILRKKTGDQIVAFLRTKGAVYTHNGDGMFTYVGLCTPK